MKRFVENEMQKYKKMWECENVVNMEMKECVENEKLTKGLYFNKKALHLQIIWSR